MNARRCSCSYFLFPKPKIAGTASVPPINKDIHGYIQKNQWLIPNPAQFLPVFSKFQTELLMFGAYAKKPVTCTPLFP
jgi:hypothetical protein